MARDEHHIFLCGDVMTGRGIDQILPCPVDPTLHESYMNHAREYVRLTEMENGPIPGDVAFDYIWGDALGALRRFSPDLRLINLETAVTTSDRYWRGKRIHYRMHSNNIGCLAAAEVDLCSLANNHVLDWGYEGLYETLGALRGEGIEIAGAGRNASEAKAPAILDTKGKGRFVMLGVGTTSSGIPRQWAAAGKNPGVYLVEGSSEQAVAEIKKSLAGVVSPEDVVIVSIHWGANWGYEIPSWQRELAHRLIDEAGVDIIHGHSSHHPKGIEVYQGRLLLYGCGDLINDYEGIGGNEEYRPELSLLYCVRVDPTSGALTGLEMVPMKIERFRLNDTATEDAGWLAERLDREGRRLGTRVTLTEEGRLKLA